jgi:hypothetical protein
VTGRNKFTPLLDMLDENKIIDYAQFPKRSWGGAYAAIFFCTPGLLCWSLYLAAKLQMPLPLYIYQLFIGLWLIAVLTAVMSLIYFFRWPPADWPWYVKTNLAVNISGLLFSLVMVVFGGVF